MEAIIAGAAIPGTFHTVGGAAEETPAAVIPFNRKPQRTPDRETDTSPGILLSPGERLDTLRGLRSRVHQASSCRVRHGNPGSH